MLHRETAIKLKQISVAELESHSEISKNMPSSDERAEAQFNKISNFQWWGYFDEKLSNDESLQFKGIKE